MLLERYEEKSCNNELVSYIIGTSDKLFKMETLAHRRYVRLIAGIVRSLFDTLIYVSNPTSMCHIIHRLYYTGICI